MYNILYKEWDSLTFGLKIGEFHIHDNQFSLDEIKEQARKEGYKLLYINSPFLIEGADLFYDEKITYEKLKNKASSPSKVTNVYSGKGKAISKSMYDLSMMSGEFSRFKLDKNFKSNIYSLLFSKWIENSVNTDYATDVLIYESNEETKGLITFKNDGPTSSIGIIAVSPSCRGLGIGTKLIQAYESSLPDNIKILDVVTQGVNKKARAFYEKNDYKLKSTVYIYHLWI